MALRAPVEPGGGRDATENELALALQAGGRTHHCFQLRNELKAGLEISL